MIILDTNVVSEIYRPAADQNVVRWYQANDVDLAFLTSITVGELIFGVSLLPEGRRKQRLSERIRMILEQEFADRTLAFDGGAAKVFGALHADHKKRGLNMSQNDIMIAAIARVHGATIATRNTRDFAHCGAALQNPFEGPPT